MLDDQNYLNQFKVGLKLNQLQAIFQDDFLPEVANFSVATAKFYSPQLSLGGQIGLTNLEVTDFSWQASQKSYLKVDNQKISLTQMTPELTDWRDLLLIWQLAGINTVALLQQLKNVWQTWQPEQPITTNQAKQLALNSAGKIGLFLTSSTYQAIGKWWRQQFETQAHNLSFDQTIDDLVYSAWDSHPVDKPFAVFDLVTEADDFKSQQTFRDKNRFLSGKMPASQLIRYTSITPHGQILELFLLGQVVSYYLASLNKQPLELQS